MRKRTSILPLGKYCKYIKLITFNRALPTEPKNSSPNLNFHNRYFRSTISKLSYKYLSAEIKLVLFLQAIHYFDLQIQIQIGHLNFQISLKEHSRKIFVFTYRSKDIKFINKWSHSLINELTHKDKILNFHITLIIYWLLVENYSVSQHYISRSLLNGDN